MARLRTQSVRRPTVIIGTGVIGTSVAYALASRGTQVLLLEQFTVGHDRGSSHGESRVIRYSYSDPLYAGLMGDAYQTWAKLEADSGIPLYLRTGGLSFGPADSDYVPSIISNLKKIGVPSRLMTAQEVRRNYPSLAMPDDFVAAFEPAAGVLMADRVPRIMVELASRAAGGLFELRENYPVSNIDLNGEFPVVIGPDQQRIEAERVVVAAGGWVRKLLPKEAKSFEVTRQSVFHLKPKQMDRFRPGNWPVLIYKGDDELDLFYAVPAISESGVKIARHGGPKIDPDGPIPDVSEMDWEPVSGFIQRFIPEWGESAERGLQKNCLYTMTPEEDFRIGYIDRHPKVILASPCSGHGFKFAPLVGRIVADLCETGMCDYDISRWKPSRESKSRRVSL